MALKKFIVGNWKMNGLLSSLSDVADIAAVASKHAKVDVGTCPPATLISAASDAHPDYVIGAQDCHAANNGAHTGCLSAAMIKEAGAKLCIVGHSERRADQGESNEDVRAKALAAHGAGLQTIICVGETEAERDSGNAVGVVLDQLAGSLPEGATGDWLTIAYEPVWAIGTGRVPGVDDVAEMHGAIREKLIALAGEAGQSVRILYGGSVNGNNANELLSVSDVDGALVGGASLTAEKFGPIIEAAAGL